jgi:beta-phosphoglucomutase-like phosphatase (HAD superfamily)
MIEAVIFDMDGVIVDTEPLHIKAEKQIMRKHGINVSTQELRKYTGTTAKFEFEELIRKHKINATVEELFKEKENILFKLLEGNVRPTKGITELIKSPKRHGVKLAIASSAHRKLIEYVLEKLGITNLFDSIVAAEDVSHSGNQDLSKADKIMDDFTKLDVEELLSFS